MSIRKLKSEYHICCNGLGCAVTLNSQCRVSKTQAWGVAARRGWLCRHAGPVWRHFCGKACYDRITAPVDSKAE